MNGTASERIDFAGVRFDRLALDDVLALLAARTADAPVATVITPNVDHIVRLDRDRARLQPLYDDADLCLCDSRILAAIARRHGVKLPVAPGSDLTARLFDTVLQPGDRIAIVGGDEGMTGRLAARTAGLDIRQHRPPMGLAHDETARIAAATFVEEARARFTFLAVGSPQQEMVAALLKARGNATGVALCIGASIDFLTGAQRRAPRWMQRLGLEWLHRLLGNPRRMARRYLVDGPRIFLIARRWARGLSPPARPRP